MLKHRSVYNLESLRVLFTSMRLDSGDDNINSLLKAAKCALESPTESEAMRLLSFAWACCGVVQPDATRHAMIMFSTLIEEKRLTDH